MGTDKRFGTIHYNTSCDFVTNVLKNKISKRKMTIKNWGLKSIPIFGTLQ